MCHKSFLVTDTRPCVLIHIKLCYIEPVVEITTVSAGCGHVNITWNVTDWCDAFSYNVTLSYTSNDIKSVMTEMKSHTFTGLPDDTQINITVTGIRVNRDILGFDSTSVRTIDIESMCKFIIKSCWLHY